MAPSVSPSVRPPLRDSAGRRRFWTFFRQLRILLLLTILAVVAFTAWAQQRHITSWRRPLTVVIVPVDPGGDHAVTQWVAQLDRTSFDSVAEFFTREAAHYGVAASPPVLLRVARPIAVVPPSPPDPPSMPGVVWWSLRLRYWSWSIGRAQKLPAATVRIYVVYAATADDATLERSLGLQRLRIGVVHAQAGADDHGWTQIAIAHELLHTVGASDKYRLGELPTFPAGWADPEREPRTPQSQAEIMSGQIPLDENGAFAPARDLALCVVGAATAAEIGWPRRTHQ